MIPHPVPALAEGDPDRSTDRSPFVARHPYRFVAALEVVVIIVYLAAGTAAHLMSLSSLWVYGIANLGLTVLAAALLTIMGWWTRVGFTSPTRRRDLLYFIVAFFPVGINLIPGVQVSGLVVLAGILATTLMVGFVEEVIFRGLMLNALKTRGPWRAVIVTSLLFGVTHGMNVLVGSAPATAVMQIAYATAFGITFAALALRKGILWPLILAHFLIDFVAFLQTPGFVFPPAWTEAIAAGTIVIFTAYGLFVMLKENTENTSRSGETGDQDRQRT